ncbi:unnamed protein product, partial [Didymodactylos carnosus]
APTALLTPDPVVSQPTLLTNFPLSFATSLPQIPNDILQKLPDQLRDVNALWGLFTSFVSSVADNPTSLSIAVPSPRTIDSLVPSSSSIQPSKLFSTNLQKRHTPQSSSFNINDYDLELESDDVSPTPKRACIRPLPQQTTTQSSDKTKSTRSSTPL